MSVPPVLALARRPAPRRRHTVLAILGVVAAWFAVHTTAILWDGLRDGDGRADLALVLGTKVEADGSPSQRLCARLDRALQLYRDGRVPRILVSGAAAAGGHDEAVVMQRYLLEHGVPGEAILVDSQGRDTWNSASQTASTLKLHGWGSVIAVSQYFHLSRAKLALRRWGVWSIAGASPRYFELRDPYSIFREFVAYYAYLVRPVR